MMTRKCNYHPYIDSYMDSCRNGTIIVGKDILAAMDCIEYKLNDPDVFIDNEKIDKAVELMERYFEIKLFDWELFVTALIHCFYKSNDTVVFSTIFILMGRGNGKNGFISPITWYLTTQYHGIKGYNIDIVANAEDQAKTSFDDIYEMLEKTWKKSKKFFYKSLELIKNLKTKSYIKFNTSNAKTKDSKRTGCLIFDEVHQYESYDNIKVFTSGFGKRKHSRAFYITTQGNVRDGVLDDMLAIAGDILNGTIKDLRWLPLLYRIDKEEEALNPKMWHKANPSLKYLPDLQQEMNQEFIEMKYKPSTEEEFYTKRMNWPKGNREIQVTEWENILATNQPIPDLTGCTCVVGIDYMKTTDFLCAGLLFKYKGKYYWLSHSWVCEVSADLGRIKAPLHDWEKLGLLTFVKGPEIPPDTPALWIAEQALNYNITTLAMDNYRYTLLAKALRDVGFDTDKNGTNNIKLIRPSNEMLIAPVITSAFVNHNIIWGNNPLMRWYTNNSCMITSKAGNITYGKIEPKSRKTDGFKAFVAAMCVSGNLPDSESTEDFNFKVYTY